MMVTGSSGSVPCAKVFQQNDRYECDNGSNKLFQVDNFVIPSLKPYQNTKYKYSKNTYEN